MGGNLYKVQRVSRERYDEIVSTLIPVLDKHFGNYYRMPKPYRNKVDYGDVDIILDAGFLVNKKWLQPVLDDLGNPPFKKVRNVTSLHYMDFQVDFFCAGTARFETTYQFMCYNILGNLIGRMFHKFNLKYGEHGLSYVLRGFNNHISKEIILTRDMRKIFEFIDLDRDRWERGFDDLQDIFDYVIGSKYFCSNSYSLDYFNVRKRAGERPDFNTFLDYLHDNGIEKNYPFNKDKSVYVPMIQEAFPKSNLVNKVAAHEELQMNLEMASQKFNGRIVMQIIQDISGKKLGQFIGEFKNLKGGKDFVNYALGTDEKKIKEDILQYYVTNFIKV